MSCMTTIGIIVVLLAGTALVFAIAPVKRLRTAGNTTARTAAGLGRRSSSAQSQLL
jgi:hypothetical protein